MGVTKLTPLISRFAPQAISPLPITHFAGSRLAFDGHILLMRFLNSGPKLHEEPHLAGFRELAYYIKYYNIQPLFIFDGKRRSASKARVVAGRIRRKQQLKKELRSEESRMEILRKLQDGANLGFGVNGNDEEAPVDEDVRMELINVVDERLKSIKKSLDEDPSANNGRSRKKTSIVIANHEVAALEKAMSVLLTISPITDDTASYQQPPQQQQQQEQQEQQEQQQQQQQQQPRVDSAVDVIKELEFVEKMSEVQVSKLQQRSQSATQEMIEQCISLLRDEFGFATYQVENSIESEALCAAIADAGLVSGVVTEDTDAIVFGNSPVLRHFFRRKQVDSDERLIHDEDSAETSSTGVESDEVKEDTPAPDGPVSLENNPFSTSDNNQLSAEADISAFASPVNTHQSHGHSNSISANQPVATEGLKRTMFTDILHIDPRLVLEGLGLDRRAFIDVCILCGTDFSPKIPGIGPVNALKLIKKHGSIENAIPHLKKPPPADFDPEAARHVFTTAPQVDEDVLAQIKNLLDATSHNNNNNIGNNTN